MLSLSLLHDKGIGSTAISLRYGYQAYPIPGEPFSHLASAIIHKNTLIIISHVFFESPFRLSL
jgi:hypothetical protein